MRLGRPRATVIEAPPGMGKSRLLGEISVRLASHPHRPQLWQAGGHPLREGSAFAVARGLSWRFFDLTGDEPRAPARDGSSPAPGRLWRGLPPGDLGAGVETRRVAEFLGEILGLEFPAENSPQLHNARRDPTVMGDQVQRAFADLLEAEAARAPLVIAIDDLHWADAASLGLLTAALQRTAERPVWLLGWTRPGAEERRAALAPLAPEVSPLPPLSAQAGEQLVRAALGAAPTADTVARLVALGDGNALFLEERRGPVTCPARTGSGHRGGTPRW